MSAKEKPTIVYAVAESHRDNFDETFLGVYSTLMAAKKRADEARRALVAEDITIDFPVVYMCWLDYGSVDGPIYEAGNREKHEQD